MDISSDHQHGERVNLSIYTHVSNWLYSETYQCIVSNGWGGTTKDHLNCGNRHLPLHRHRHKYLHGCLHWYLHLWLQSSVVALLGLVSRKTTCCRWKGCLVPQRRPSGLSISALWWHWREVTSLGWSASLWIRVWCRNTRIAGGQLRRVARLWLMALASSVL